jgi:hypothetical protein
VLCLLWWPVAPHTPPTLCAVVGPYMWRAVPLPPSASRALDAAPSAPGPHKRSQSSTIRAWTVPSPRTLATAPLNLVLVTTRHHFAAQAALATPMGLRHIQSGHRQKGWLPKMTVGAHAMMSNHQPLGGSNLLYVAMRG